MKKNLLYDLGGHYGESIRYFAKYLPSPSIWDVITVEASPLNYTKLHKTCEEYKDSFSKITDINAFVYHKNEPITFFEYTDELHSAGSTYSKEKFIKNSNKKAEYKNLSHNILQPEIFNIVESYKDNVNIYNEIIIKMDIEGAEYDILPDLLDIINPINTREIFIEFHNWKVNVDESVDRHLIDIIKSKNIKFDTLNNLGS